MNTRPDLNFSFALGGLSTVIGMVAHGSLGSADRENITSLFCDWVQDKALGPTVEVVLDADLERTMQRFWYVIEGSLGTYERLRVAHQRLRLAITQEILTPDHVTKLTEQISHLIASR